MDEKLQHNIEAAIDDLRLLIAELKCGENQHSKRLMKRLKGLLQPKE